MDETVKRFWIYIDQSLLSDLRPDKPKLPLTDIITTSFEKVSLNGINPRPAYVYSDAHVQEILKSRSTDTFFDLLERLDACHISLDGKVTRGAEKRYSDFYEGAATFSTAFRALESLIAVLLLLIGFLPPSARGLIEEFQKSAFDELFDHLEVETEGFGTAMIEQLRQDMHKQIDETSRTLTSSDDIEKVCHAHALPHSVAEHFASKPADERTEIQQRYPENFRLKKQPVVGDISALCLYLSVSGLIKTSSFHKRDPEKSIDNFSNQWRDCCHIEAASHCDLFLTRDSGQFKMAQMVYAYSGARTKVGLFKTSSEGKSQ